MERLATSTIPRRDLTSPVTTEAHVLQHLPATGSAVMQTISACSGFVAWKHCLCIHVHSKESPTFNRPAERCESYSLWRMGKQAANIPLDVTCSVDAGHVMWMLEAYV